MKTALFVLPLLAAPPVLPANPVQDMVDSAAARGETRVTLPPGEHRLESALRLQNLKGFTLDGSGAILVFTDLRDGGISVNDCQGLTLRGFTVDFDPLPFTQGTIDSVDRERGLVTYTLHVGYPDLSPVYGGHRAHVFDAATLDWKRGAPDLYASAGRRLSARRGELRFSPDRRWQLDGLAAGDHLVQDVRRGRGIRIDRSSDIVVDNVTLWSAPGIAMTCRFMDGVNRFTFKVARGPKPAAASVPRLFSTSADAFNYAYARTGPIIENCDFSFMGDDSVNLHGIAFIVAGVGGDVIHLLRPYGREGFASVVRPGDEVRALAQGNFDLKAATQVVSFEVEPDPDPRYLALAPSLYPLAEKTGKATLYRLRVAQPLPLATGDFIEIPAIAAPGYVIRNNRFGHHRGRALRLMSSHGVVEGNAIEGVKQAAITLGPEFVGFREAGWVRDVIVRGNTIRDSSFDPALLRHAAYTPGAISVMHRGETPGTPRPVNIRHENIRIEDNLVENVGGPGIHINQARDVVIRGNRLVRTNRVDAGAKDNPYGLNVAGPIGVDGSENVTIDP